MARMEDTSAAREMLKVKERQVNGVYSDINSVRRPPAKERFLLLLELGKSLMEMEEHVDYREPGDPKQTEMNL